ncbi:uncharacterized protein LOC129698430 [Leucoraja erinacea]|uniref:uncharacterized protein LOC129698430 n=1 Tax=Leucoraja erinaceus TaxID=7782 RepID=UPI0024557626|nr:uncharacterized protein LOC129698430 [Leucoraja erinacea]
MPAVEVPVRSQRRAGGRVSELWPEGRFVRVLSVGFTRDEPERLNFPSSAGPASTGRAPSRFPLPVGGGRDLSRYLFGSWCHLEPAGVTLASGVPSPGAGAMISQLLEQLGMSGGVEPPPPPPPPVSWWRQPPASPKPHYTRTGEVVYQLLSLLWTTDEGVAIAVTLGLFVVTYILAGRLASYLCRSKWLKEPQLPEQPTLRRKKRRAPCQKCRLRKEQKKTQCRWKPGINESTGNEQETQKCSPVSLHNTERGFHCKKQKQHNAIQVLEKIKFDETRHGTDDNKTANENAIDVPILDHPGYDCCGKKSNNSGATVTADKLSSHKSRSISKNRLLGKHASVGTNTSDQFSSDEIWRMTPSGSWTNTDQYLDTNEYLNHKHSDSSKNNIAYKESGYDGDISEKYSVYSCLKDGETAKSKETPGEIAKETGTQLSTSELCLSNSMQTAKTTYSNVTTVNENPCVNANKLTPHSVVQTPVFSSLTPMLTPEVFESISLSSSDGCSANKQIESLIHLNDIYHLEEKNAEIKNTDFDTSPLAQEVAFSQENYEKIEFIQVKNGFQSVAEHLEITRSNQGITDKDWQTESGVYQTLKSEAPSFDERQVTCFNINLGKHATHKWNGLVQYSAETQKSPEVPLDDDSIELVEIKAYDVEKSSIYHNQMSRFEVKLAEDKVNSFEDIKKIGKAKLNENNDYQESHLGRKILQNGSNIFGIKQQFEELSNYHTAQTINETDALQQQSYSAHQPAKIESELLNKSVIQEMDISNKTIEITRPGSLPFIKKDAIKYMERNFKNRLIANFWEYPSNTEKSARAITSRGALTVRNVQSDPVVMDEKMRNCLKWQIAQREFQHSWDLSSDFEKPTEDLVLASPKCIPMQLIDGGVISNELSFITVEHKNMIEGNVKRKIASNKFDLQQSLDYIIAAPPQSENLEQNNSLLGDTDKQYPFKMIPHREDIKGREKIFPSPDGGTRDGERNKLKELSVTTLKLNETSQLDICLAKQQVELELDGLLNVVREADEQFDCPVTKQRLPKLICVGNGYKKSRPLSIHFMERDAVDRIAINLRQKLILSVWDYPNSFERSLETMIPKAPPVPPPIKARATKIELIGMEIDFIEKKTRNHLERHIVRRKRELNGAVPSAIQRSRDIFMPPAPKLIDSQQKSPTEQSFNSIEYMKILEVNLKKRIINHKHGLPNGGQESIINVMDSNSMKDTIASSDFINGRNILTGNSDYSKRTLRDDNRMSTEQTKVFTDKLEMCIRKQCLEINMGYFPEIVREMYNVTYSCKSKSTLPKLIAPGRGYKKSRPPCIHFIEQDLIDRLQLNLKHKQISYLWRLETLHKRSFEMMTSNGQWILPSNKITVKKVVPVALKTHFISNDTRSLLEQHMTQRKLQHNWSVPLHIQRSQQAFIPPAPKLIVSQLKPQPDFDINVIPIEPTFLSAENKNKLELTVKRRIINHHFGLPKFVHLSMESFIPHAPSPSPVRPQLGIAENESLINDICKAVCLPSKHLQLKGGELTVPQCEQSSKFEKASKNRILPSFDFLKSEHKDKLAMCLIKQCLNIKLNYLPSIVQEHYKNTYASEPEKTSFKLLRPGEGFKKTRSAYIPFFECDAITRLEMNMKNKHISHLWGFQTLHEKSMEIMIPKGPPDFPAIKANKAQIEAASMGTLFISRDVRCQLEWQLTQKKLQHNWGFPLHYQKSMETFIPAAPKLVSSQLNSQVDFMVVNTPCKLPFVDCEISKKIELNIKKKIINQTWGLPTLIQSSLETFMPRVPPVNKKPSEAVPRKKLKTDNIKIKEPYKTENLQKKIVQQKQNKLTSAHHERKRKKSKTKNSGGKFIFAQLKQEDKHKSDVCVTKQSLEIHMNALPKCVTKFYKSTYPPLSKRSLPRLIMPGSGFKKPVPSHISFIKQDIVDQLELNLKHKQMNHLWGLASPYVESLTMVIPAGPPVPPPVKASGAQIEPVGREINFSADVRKDLEMHVTQKKLQHNGGLPLLIQKSENIFIPPAPKLMLSELKSQPDFEFTISVPELTFLNEEHKRILEFNIKKRIVNHKWGLPKVVQSSLCNFMAPAPSMKKSLGLKLKHKNKLNVCLTKQSLDVKMDYLPDVVKEFYKNTYGVPLKKPLPRLIACNEGFRKPRPVCIPLIEQDVVDCIELNLKHKHINHLWALDTKYEMSIKMIIPRGPNVQPDIRTKGVQRELVGVETVFIEVEIRDMLEWHVTQKKLENNLDLPLHIQKSIPSAPKPVSSQSKQHCFNDVAVASEEPVFINSEHRKCLELNIKKKIINQKWGLPNRIQLSMKEFMPSPQPLQNYALKSKTMKGCEEFNSKMILRATKETLHSKNANIRKISASPHSVKLKKEHKWKLNTCLLMQILNSKMHCLPEIIQESLNNSYPAVLKNTLTKPVMVNEGFKKQRPWHLPFVEQDAIDHLEQKLKHKQIIHLWKLETQHDKSMEVMIPKGPPLPPAIKASGVKIELEGTEASFVARDSRDRLEWHITQKKLQQHWGLPPHIQKSAECFIPSAPKLIPPHLNLKPSFGVMVATNELPFMNKKHRKLLEFNVKKKIINNKLGIPTLIQSSLRDFMGLNCLRNEPEHQSGIQIARKPGSCGINIENKVEIPSQKTETTTCLQHKKDSQNTKPYKTKVADIFGNFQQESIDKIDVCIRKSHLENKLHGLPEMVKQMYKENYPSESTKKVLKKIIVPGEGCKKIRCLYIAFIEQDAVDRLELNLKHRLILSLWGLATPCEKSIEMMIPEGPPVFPAVKSAEVKIDPKGMEILFIASKVRETLESHVMQNKLQRTWGLPIYVQRSEEAFIPIAPKLISSHLKPQPACSVVIVPSKLSFLHDDHKKLLEKNVKKKIINSKFGLPTLIQSSLNMFTAASSDLYNLTNMDKERQMIPQHTFPIIKCGELSSSQERIYDRSKKSKKIDDLSRIRLCPETKHILENCVLKLCLENKSGYFPEMVSKFYESTYSSQPNKPLPKLIAPGRGFKISRPYYLPFIGQDTVDQVELNLRHKNIIHLWKVPNLYDISKERMISKGPPVPPAVKGSGAVFYSEHLEIGLIEDEVKDKLEWHITQKKLQHHFRLPLPIQKSQEAFIPYAPKLILSQLKIVYKMYEATFTPISKRPFPKPIAPGKGFKKPRSLYISSIEHDVVDCLELNLKHKHLTHLCGITTLFQESVALMIPKGPPVPAAIKASGAQIEHIGMDTTFIYSEIKDRLEWHIVQKKLQHNWDDPSLIQISQETFIPPAPKLIASQLKPQVDFSLVIFRAETIFLPAAHRKVLELNMKKRIINCKLGLPKSVQLSVRCFIPAAPQMKDFIPQCQKQLAPVTTMSTSTLTVLCMKNERLLSPKLQINIKSKENHGVSFDNFKVKYEDVIGPCLIKQNLEIKMGHLPDLVRDSYSATDVQASEKTLTKAILPSHGFKKYRSSKMSFIVQNTIDCLELNLKHKQIIHQWGYLSLHEESMEMMIPKGPPLPPIIKASGGRIEPLGTEIIFISCKTRETLECQISQKKLQYNWGLPIHIQSSLNAFIPHAPKLILSQLNAIPDFRTVVVTSEAAFLSDECEKILDRNVKKKIINCKLGLPKVIYSSLIQFMGIPGEKDVILPSKGSNKSKITHSYNIRQSEGTNLCLKGGKLPPQCEDVEMTMHQAKETSFNSHLRPECQYNLNIIITKQSLETKMDCIPKRVKDSHKIAYPPVSKKPLAKLIVSSTGLKKTRPQYIPFVEQFAVDQIEMNLKHRELLCVCGHETLYEKSMVMMISKGPPLPPLIKAGRTGIKPVEGAASTFAEEITNVLNWHILQKKMEHICGASSHFQKSAEAFIPPAPELTLTKLNPQPNFEIEIAAVELTFVNNEHKKLLEINTKKRIENHRWGLPKVIESSLKEFMAPAPLMKDKTVQFNIKAKCRSRFIDISKNYKMFSAQRTSHFSKGQKNTLDCEYFKEIVGMKTREITVFSNVLPESKNKLNMCLMKQNVSNKLDCVPELVKELYQQSYSFSLKKPLAKLITAGKGFKRPRLSHILFVEQDIINGLDMNLKHKQLNNLWGTTTIFDISIEKMIPEPPSMFPAIKAIDAKVEHVGMELTFQSAETTKMFECHIKTKQSQQNLCIPLHLQRSIDTLILLSPKQVPSQFTQHLNLDTALSVNDLRFINEEHKEDLERNTGNENINYSRGVLSIIHASCNSFIPAAPTIKKDLQLLRTDKRSTIELEQSELSKIDIIAPADHSSMTSTNCRDFDKSSNVNCMEESFTCPEPESSDKDEVYVAKQSSEMNTVDECICSASSKHFLNLNTPHTSFKKQNLKGKCDNHLVDYSIDSPNYKPKSVKTVVSSTWISNQKLVDLTYDPMAIEGFCLSQPIQGESVASCPLTMQEDLNFYKQNTDSVLLPLPGPYVDCEEMLLKIASDIENDESCSKQLTEEATIHIQQDEEHAYVKITAGVVINQNEEKNMEVDLSGRICSQPPPTAFCDSVGEKMIIASQIHDDGNYLNVSDEECSACYETLNKSYHTSKSPVVKKKCRKAYQNCCSKQTQPDMILANSKTKFSRQGCQRSRKCKHNEEGRNSELGSQSFCFAGTTKEMQNTIEMTYSSDTDQKGTSLTQETSQNHKDDKQSSQSSTLRSPERQQVVSIKHPLFAVNENFEDSSVG